MSNVEVSRALQRDNSIKLHGPDGFAGMMKAGQLAAAALDMITPHVKPGVATDHLDALVMEFARDHGAIPAPLNYRGFPKAICTSINHVVCHGIPGPKPLREGDIVNIDVTLIVDGWHGDTSRMYAVGEISRRAERLIEVTYECLMRGIAAVKPGVSTGKIGAVIQQFAVQCGARFLRARVGPCVPRPAEHFALRRGERGRRDAARNVLHDRADDQSRQGLG
jgi:methionyl aminopeptidase